MIETQLTKKAMKLCSDLHNDQIERGTLPYSFYLAERMDDEDSVCTVLLLDIISEGHTTITELRREGFSKETIDALYLLNPKEKNNYDPQSYLPYIANVMKNPIARKIKMEKLKYKNESGRFVSNDLSAIRNQMRNNRINGKDYNRLFVISDLHGYNFDKFLDMLQKVYFSDDDLLIILGDVVDRDESETGENIIKLLRFILSHQNCILLRGNHEQLVLENLCMIEQPRKLPSELTIQECCNFLLWMDNGGECTYKMFYANSDEENKLIMQLFRNSPLYLEVFLDNKRYVLTHAGLGSYDPNKKLTDYTAKELLWYRPEINERFWLGEDSMLLFGHTPTVYMDENNMGEPIFNSTWINIDTGAALGDPYSPCLFCLNDFTWIKPDQCLG